MLPNFLIVGAPKAGTTSLYHYLSDHPDVFMSNPKEVNYFSREAIEAQCLYYDDIKIKTLSDYESLFKPVINEKTIGEGSVSYLYYTDTPRKILETLGNIKIIIMLRDPIDRGFSHYLMDRKLGLVNSSYSEIVSQSGQHKHQHLYYQQYVKLGLYYEQVKRYLDTFRDQSVKIILQEDLRDNPDQTIIQLYEFLGINTTYKSDLSIKHNSFSEPKNPLVHSLYSSHFLRTTVKNILPKAILRGIKNCLFQRTIKPSIDTQTLSTLSKLYREDLDKLSTLIGIDLSNWARINDR